MKAFIYLICLIGITVLIVWFGYGKTPLNQWQWVKGYTANSGAQLSVQISNTENSAGKLKSKLGKHFDEAADVYQGKEKPDPFQSEPQ